jgi:hypothetical protein
MLENDKTPAKMSAWNMLRLEHLARRDPQQGSQLLQQASEKEIALLNPDLVMILCAEMVNQGHSEQAQSVLEKVNELAPEQFAIWKDLVLHNQTENLPLLYEQNLRPQAAAYFIQARRAKEESVAKGFRENAMRADVFRGNVTAMMRWWKP